MPPTSIWYQGYDRDAFDLRYERREDDDGISSSSLSTFQIPSSVTVEIRTPTYLAFVFTYPNDEPPDRFLWDLPNDPTVKLRLSRKTRKIIEVRFTEAEDRVRARDLSFDPILAASWARELQPYEQRSAMLNADLVSRILSSVPNEMIQKIRRLMQEYGKS